MSQAVTAADIYAEDFSCRGRYFLGSQPFVDRNRIGAIGICGSGSFVISAAKIDPRIATVSMSRVEALGSEETPPERYDAGVRFGEQVSKDIPGSVFLGRKRGTAAQLPPETNRFSSRSILLPTA
jgi:hypothetical protein